MATPIAPTAKQKSILMMHLVAFIIVNAIIWFMWNKAGEGLAFNYPWPIWLTSAWFLSLIGHWAALYTNYPDKGYDKFVKDSTPN
jgi:hypothetical protein